MTFWIDEAKKHIGTREIKGVKHNTKIVAWWQKTKLHFRDDETPWCAAFVGGVLEDVGIKSTRSAAARSYLKWGWKVDKPVYGAIVVFWRGSPSSWSGHVGFVVGKDRYGNIIVLGGNQGDEVNLRAFSSGRVLGYRFPQGQKITNTKLPIYDNLKLSTNEA